MAPIPLGGRPALILDFDPEFPAPPLTGVGELIVAADGGHVRPEWGSSRALDLRMLDSPAPASLPEQAVVITIETCAWGSLLAAWRGGVRRFHVMHSRRAWVTTSARGLVSLLAAREVARSLESRAPGVSGLVRAAVPIGLTADHDEPLPPERAAQLARQGAAAMARGRPNGRPTLVLVVPGELEPDALERVGRVRGLAELAGLSVSAIVVSDDGTPAKQGLRAAGLFPWQVLSLDAPPLVGRRGMPLRVHAAFRRHPEAVRLFPLFDRLCHGGVDVVHAWGEVVGGVAALAGVMAGASRVVVEPTGRARPAPWVGGTLAALADRVVVTADVSENAARATEVLELPRHMAIALPLAPLKKRETITTRERAWARRAVGIGPEALLLVALKAPASDEERKALIALPGAWEPLGLEVHVVVLGGGPEAARIRALAACAGRTVNAPLGRLRLLGPVLDVDGWAGLADALLEPVGELWMDLAAPRFPLEELHPAPEGGPTRLESLRALVVARRSALPPHGDNECSASVSVASSLAALRQVYGLP